MREHKFRTFLESRNWNDVQSKSFLDNAIIEPTLPDAIIEPTLPDATTWEQLKEHLVVNKTEAGTIGGVKIIWDLYEREVLGKLE
mgnify:CR=1 FL=1